MLGSGYKDLCANDAKGRGGPQWGKINFFSTLTNLRTTFYTVWFNTQKNFVV